MPTKKRKQSHSQSADGKPREYNANPSAARFHESPARIKAICGAAGSGKSVAACIEYVLLCMESDVPLSGLVVRETYRQLKDATRRTWLEWIPEPASQWRENDKKIEFTIPNRHGKLLTHELHFRHARSAADATQFLSTEYAFIWLEEPVPAFEKDTGIIGSGLPEGVFETCITRQRSSGAHRVLLVLTFNPPSKFHWVYKRFFLRSPEELRAQGVELIRQPPRENAKHLIPGYYENMELNLSPEMVQRFVMGEPVTQYPGARVHPMFIDNLHFREGLALEEGAPLVLAWDFGLKPACVIAQVLHDGRMRIYRELVTDKQNRGISRAIDALDEILKESRFRGYKVGRSWGDPSGAAEAQTDQKTCFGILASRGYPCSPGAIDLTSRKEAVNQRAERMIAGDPAVLIDSAGCPTLHEGLLGGYRYAKSIDQQISPVPLKNLYSHVCDAFQYLASGEFNVRTGRKQTKEKQVGAMPRQRFNPLEPDPAGDHGSWMSR